MPEGNGDATVAADGAGRSSASTIWSLPRKGSALTVRTPNSGTVRAATHASSSQRLSWKGCTRKTCVAGPAAPSAGGAEISRARLRNIGASCVRDVSSCHGSEPRTEGDGQVIVPAQLEPDDRLVVSDGVEEEPEHRAAPGTPALLREPVHDHGVVGNPGHLVRRGGTAGED